MQTLIFARAVANFVNTLPDFEVTSHARACYSSMGAVLIDAVLQAGLSYNCVVAPRVRYFLQHYPTVNNSSDFLECLRAHGAERVLRWTHSEKIERLIDLTEFFVSEGIETVENLFDWIVERDKREVLLTLHGIGRKTVDYLAMLVGVPSIAVDRHLRKFIRAAGVDVDDYDDNRRIAEIAADLLQAPRSAFDYAVWSYVSAGKLTHPTFKFA